MWWNKKGRSRLSNPIISERPSGSYEREKPFLTTNQKVRRCESVKKSMKTEGRSKQSPERFVQMVTCNTSSRREWMELHLNKPAINAIVCDVHIWSLRSGVVRNNLPGCHNTRIMILPLFMQILFGSAVLWQKYPTRNKESELEAIEKFADVVLIWHLLCVVLSKLLQDKVMTLSCLLDSIILWNIAQVYWWILFESFLLLLNTSVQHL